MPIIDVQHISKIYPARRGARDLRGRGGLGDWLRGRKTDSFEALRDITFSVEPGESLGIIGRNGSGKSTLLKILAGVTLPTRGEVTVLGRVASMLELGAGFHPILTGRENIYLNAGLLGMRRAQVHEVLDHIIDFSGIGEFIDQPVETYSSGMYVRIAFAVAAHVNPDVFLVDEVLSVGDEEFQRKCRTKIGELREQGKTIIFVSHDLGAVSTLCERIILLNKGEMVLRDTPQKTISYYLRQIGREDGVHTYTDGPLEAIFCEGRVSLFRDGVELTAPSGFSMTLNALAMDHPSTLSTDWRIIESRPDGCLARGRMTRLPVQLIWDQQLRDGRLRIHAAMECEHAVSLNRLQGTLALPVTYQQWLYGDLAGAFPKIRPGDSNFDVLVAPEKSSQHAAAFAENDAQWPPLAVDCTLHNPLLNTFWANSDYTLHSRIFGIGATFPENASSFPAGRHDLFTLDIGPERGATQIRSRIKAERTVQAGSLEARFERGHFALSVGGREITSFLHVYTSLLIEHLWHDSFSLQWDLVPGEGAGIELVGESRRFPLRQRWQVEPDGDRVALRMWLEAIEPLDVMEYHCSVLLRSEYDRWKTEYEDGAFPAFDPQVPRWLHFNQTYRPGAWISALGPGLPEVTLAEGPEVADIPYRMTALNTTHKENARVIQALRTPDTGCLHFEPGRHWLFAGSIVALAPEQTPEDTRT
jgi:ABC-type polysaccharide/polyol phosphate transport system ATPase subunit